MEGHAAPFGLWSQTQPQPGAEVSTDWGRSSPVVHGSGLRELHWLLRRCSHHHAWPWLHASCQGHQSILHHSRLGSYAGWLPVPLHLRWCTDRLTLPLVGHLHQTVQRKSGPAA